MDIVPQARVPKSNEDELLRRAAAAYLVDSDGRWPDELESGIERHARLNYVVLRDAKGKLLAVYRLRSETGEGDRKRKAQLKRLVRLPEGLA